MKGCFGLGAGLTLLTNQASSSCRSTNNLYSEEKSSLLSQKIAEYLVQNGTETHTSAGFPGYAIKKVLPDGRKLDASVAYFSYKGKKGSERDKNDAILRLIITPVKDDQFGEFSMESRLDGKFSFYRILTGTSDKMIEGWFHFSYDSLPINIRKLLQKKYGRFRERVYNLLKEDSK